MQLPTTVNPPHYLQVKSGKIAFNRIASHIYDLSLLSNNKPNFLGRIEQKSNYLWAVTYVNSQHCIPEYFDDWQQATVYLLSLY